MDIDSFRGLVLKMLTGRLPAPEDRPGQACSAKFSIRIPFKFSVSNTSQFPELF